MIARDFYTLALLYSEKRVNKLIYSPDFYLTTLKDEKFFIEHGLKAVVDEAYRYPYTFELEGILIFSENALENSTELEEWEKERIIYEAYYITDSDLYKYYREEFLLFPPFAFSYGKEIYFVVKYEFPCNIYIVNYTTKGDNPAVERWIENARKLGIPWKSYFYFDFYGKKPTLFKLMEEKENEFINSAKVLVEKLALSS